MRSLLGQMPHTGAHQHRRRETASIGYVPQTLDFDKRLPITVGDFMAMVETAPARVPRLSRAGARESTAARAAWASRQAQRKLGSLSGGSASACCLRRP